MRRWLVLAGLVAVAGSAGAQSSPSQVSPDLSALAGPWIVVGVKVRGTDAQALQEDDPDYMGAVLDISKERLQWRPHEGGTLGDICDRPRLVGASVRCGSGEFGPPGATLTLSDGRLVLTWYDNANLILQRQR